MRKLLHFILKQLARSVLKKYRPLVVAITGSAGKTSAKEAIYTVLRNKKNVRQSIGNYNNEIGLPLAVLGCQTGGRSFIKWFKVFLTGWQLIFNEDKSYPDILVLEMGAEKKGDIKYLTNFVQVDIGVITSIGPVHIEFFGSVENIRQEKFSIFRHFKDESKIAVINIDDKRIKNSKNSIKGKVITYGFDNEANFRASDYKIVFKNNSYGTMFKLTASENSIPVFLPNILGKNQILACLAALAVCSRLNGNLLDAIDSLTTKYRPPKGRTNIIKGIKNTVLIDDSYNASPPSTLSALDILEEMPTPSNNRLIAVLGEMLELGSYSEKGHREVGKKSAEVKVDMLVVVGERSRDILRGAISAGMPEEKTFYFNNNHDAGIFVQDKLKQNDIVLIKGSQGARMEQIVRELMAEPLKAEELLVRQSAEWMK